MKNIEKRTTAISSIYNEDDDNVFVPRTDRMGIMGMTLNWAHPISKIFALALLATIVFPVFINIKVTKMAAVQQSSTGLYREQLLYQI